MARILNIGSEWFEQVEPSSFAESELEERVVLHAPSIYPEYYVMPFKQTIQSSYGPVKPDLIFISRNYQEWRVVEVEMSYHSLGSHVEPQIQKLADGIYGKEVAEYLCRHNAELDFNQMLQLITNIPPQVLVIVNEQRIDWIRPLSRYGAILAVFELFRSDNEHEIFRVDGEYPTLLVDTISSCSFHPYIRRLLTIEQPDNLNLPLRGKVKLRYNNCMTEWKRLDYNGKVYLQPEGRNPLNSDHDYEILKQGDDSLVLRRLDSK